MSTERNLKKLQNGSDIRGIALSGIEGEHPNLLQEEAELLTTGYLLWLSEKTKKQPSELKIAIGRDPRLSGKKLMQSAINSLVPYGVTVLNAGLASTPAMYMSTVFDDFACDGAIMLTASHLPFNRNGFKYFDKNGGLNKSDISKIIEYAENIEATYEALGARIADDHFEMKLGQKEYIANDVALMDRYCAHLRDLIKKGVRAGLAINSTTSCPCNNDLLGKNSNSNHSLNAETYDYEKPLAGMHIIVDAGNGGGGFYATKVLSPLGANVTGSIYLEPDGTFPNHAPNPEDAEAMNAISMAVLGTSADLGLIFDTDVDRSAAVDSRGREISRNGIVAMAAALIADEHPGTTVVTDSITSDELSVFLEKTLGLTHLRFKRGYKNVINKSIELNEAGIDSQLAIETSGHAAFKENYFLDDGAYLATKIVIKTALLHKEGKAIDSVIEALSEPVESREVRFPIMAKDFAAYGDKILSELASHIEMLDCDISLVTPNYEGVRISFGKDSGDGWCLLRKSLHDPIMPLNLESNTQGGTDKMAQFLRSFLTKYTELDISKL